MSKQPVTAGGIVGVFLFLLGVIFAIAGFMFPALWVISAIFIILGVTLK